MKKIRLLLGLCSALISQASFSDSTTAQAHAIIHSVNGAKLQLQSQYQVQRKLAGTLVAAQETAIGFELAGKIAKVYVNSGENVQQGQLLAQLDTQLLQLERQQLEAQVAEAQAKLDLVLSSLKRQQSLKQEGYASEQQLDELESDKKTLNAQLQRLKLSVNSVDSRLEKSMIKAPFNAKVSRRLAAGGAVVGAGSPVFQLLQNEGLEAHVGVPLMLTKSIKPTQALSLSVNGLAYEAKLITLGADISTVTRTRMVRLSTPVITDAVPGMMVYLTLPQTIKQSGYWVPISSLTDGLRGLWSVYTLNALDNGNYQVSAQSVRIAYSEGHRAYIIGDLSHSNLIVSDGIHRIVNGQQVSLAKQAEE